MTKQKKPGRTAATTDNKRRNFMIGTGLGGVAAAVALVSNGASAPAATADKVAETQEEGYRETDHIRRYYGTTRL